MADEQPNAPRRRAASWCWPVAIAVAVVAIDQAVKAVVRAEVPQGSVREVIPGVDLVHTENTGVSFGALGGLPVWGVALVSTVALTLVITLLLRAAPGRLGRIAAALIAGGAIGNLIDRAARGAVTDFLDLPLLPPCNVADIAITFGAIAMIFALLLAPDGNQAADDDRESPAGSDPGAGSAA